MTLLLVQLFIESQTGWGWKGLLEVIFSTSPCFSSAMWRRLLRTFSLILSDSDSQEPTASSQVVSKKGAVGTDCTESLAGCSPSQLPTFLGRWQDPMSRAALSALRMSCETQAAGEMGLLSRHGTCARFEEVGSFSFSH